MATATNPPLPFPNHGLLNRIDTQAAAFIKKFNAYDGRNTVIAILDTGVDPGAPGMQVTTAGQPKVIDIIDCTGAGDVKCSTLVTLQDTSSKQLKGLSGRTLTIGDWVNPSGKYRLGLKSAADIFPRELVARLKKDRKTKFEVEHHALLTQIATQIADFDTKHPGGSDPDVALAKSDLKARYEALKDSIKSYDDHGMMFDCVVFHDGNTWRAVIDIDESGDLTCFKPMASFKEERQWSCFGVDSMLNFSVNIYDDGEILSIATLAGSHGTHVAAIAAAHFPDSPELDGVAPGAQLISLKIGDTRLGSMETNTALVRAATLLAQLKPDLANMSYGEACALTQTGRFHEIIEKDVVNKAGVVFVSSAGNEGPAISTVSAPASNSSGMIGVGAWVSGAMREAEYALLKGADEETGVGAYTWCSRGPTTDGDTGMTIFAPGAAITSVPQFTIQHSQLMNGTSMASPCACGCLALVISGLKGEGIAYTPYSIKAAVRNTALRPLPIGGERNEETFGVGLVQVEKCFEYLTGLMTKSNLDVQYVVSTDNGERGVYLRELDETSTVGAVGITVQPKFLNADEPRVNASKLTLELQMSLSSTASWIQAPDFLLLNNGGRTFSIKIDPVSLPPGLHYAEVQGFDTKAVDAGPLFRVPVTVVKPLPREPSAVYKFENVRFEPGTVERRFIAVPADANFVEIIMKTETRPVPARFYIHTLQLAPQSRFDKHEYQTSVLFGSSPSGEEVETTFWSKYIPCLGGTTMEVCIAQFWSTVDQTVVSIETKFHGILCGSSTATGASAGVHAGGGGTASGHLLLDAGSSGFSRVDVVSTLRKEEISPSVTLDTVRKTIRPSESNIRPLGSRDVLPDTRQVQQLVLTYNIRTVEGVSVTPRFPRFQDVLYESSVENFACIVFDAHKRMLSFQDVYPKSVKLGEGNYVVRVQLASYQVDLLEKLVNMPMVLDMSLSKSVNLSIYSRLAGVIGGSGESFKKRTLQKGERDVMWVGGVDDKAYPKDVKPGDYLLGKLDILGGGRKLEKTLYSVIYVVPPEAKSNGDGNGNGGGSSSSGEEKPDDQSLLKAAIRDLEISWLKKFGVEEHRDELLARLERDNPDHLPLLQVKLELLVAKAEKALGSANGDPETLKLLFGNVVETADRITGLIDLDKLAIYYGVKRDVNVDKEKAKKKEMDKMKETAVIALGWKTWVLKELVVVEQGIAPEDEGSSGLPSTETPAPDSPLSKFDAALAKWAEWLADPQADGKYLVQWLWRSKTKRHYGTALKAVNKYLSDPKNAAAGANGEKDDVGKTWRKLVDVKIELLKELGWGLWARYEEKWIPLKFPKEYALF
ncbi:Tripeptidyl peptidase II-domain-containing protein [Cladochytrium replicatum]|nr:Tripeptidyl peptidase II-domain-containing protein [Cladochytrium replicatum]